MSKNYTIPKIIFCLGILVFISSFKNFSLGERIVWNLNGNDSLAINRILIKDSIKFTYIDSNRNIFKNITAKKISSVTIPIAKQVQDIDPTRNMGAIVTSNTQKITYWDSINNFKISISIEPTYDLTGTIRLPSYLKFNFNEIYQYKYSVSKDGLPNHFMIYDNFNYKNTIYKNCNYNPEALKYNIGINILDKTGFPMLLENKNQKIYIKNNL